MSKPPRVFRLGVLADLHVGSRYALVPPAFRGDPGPAGMFLDYMWACWLDFVKHCPPLDRLRRGVVRLRAVRGAGDPLRDVDWRQALTDLSHLMRVG